MMHTVVTRVVIVVVSCHPCCEEMKVSPSSSVAIGTLYRFSAGCIAQYDCTCQTGPIR